MLLLSLTGAVGDVRFSCDDVNPSHSSELVDNGTNYQKLSSSHVSKLIDKLQNKLNAYLSPKVSIFPTFKSVKRRSFYEKESLLAILSSILVFKRFKMPKKQQHLVNILALL